MRQGKDGNLESEEPILSNETKKSVGFGLICFLVGCIVTLCLTPSDQSSQVTKWETKYYELSCTSKGLVLNRQNYGLYLCMDPKTKALYESGE
jgi:hypothetical protein